MENTNNKKDLLIVALTIIILILCCALVFVLVSKKDKKETKKPTTQDVVEDTKTVEKSDYTSKCDAKKGTNTTYIVDVNVDKYDNIFDYIKEQENLSIKLYYVKQENIDNGTYTNDEYVFTNDEINTYLSQIRSNRISVFNADLGGAGGSSIEISYTREGNTYTVGLRGGTLIYSTDGNIYKLMDSKLATEDFNFNCHYSIASPEIYDTILNSVK